MKTVLRVLGIMLGVLVAIIVVALAAVFIISERGINKTYAINVTAPPIPTDAAAIAEGERIATIRGCTGCHTANLGGEVMIEGAPGRIVAVNLTRGVGGIGGTFDDADWVRAIRHGVGKDGKGLWIMPSTDFRNMSDDDIGKLIAYLKSVPPVDNNLGPSSLGLLFRALYATGTLPLIAAEKIDHAAPVSAPPVGETVAYGGYVAATCTGCHGANLSGGPTPGSSADDIPAANLTPAGNLKNWTEAQFIEAIRTGKTPEGKQLDPNVMPWPGFAPMTDTELKAIWLYLQSLPPTPTGSR